MTKGWDLVIFNSFSCYIKTCMNNHISKSLHWEILIWHLKDMWKFSNYSVNLLKIFLVACLMFLKHFWNVFDVCSSAMFSFHFARCQWMWSGGGRLWTDVCKWTRIIQLRMLTWVQGQWRWWYQVWWWAITSLLLHFSTSYYW